MKSKSVMTGGVKMCNTSGHELVIDLLMHDLRKLRAQLTEALEKLEALE